MFLTNFFSEKKSFTPPNKNKIRTTIKNICTQENKELGFINCVFCSDEYLLEVNKKYLKHHFYTDVITFDFSVNVMVFTILPSKNISIFTASKSNLILWYCILN